MPFDEERTETRTIEVPGMMIIAQFTLGGQGRSVQFSKSIDGDLQQHELDHMLDQLARAADRMSAKYGLPDRRRKLWIAEKILEDNQAKLAEKQDELQGHKNKRLEDARKIEKEYGSLYDALYLEHHKKGYQGEFEPKGADAQRLQRMKDAMQQLAQPIGGPEADCVDKIKETEKEIRDGIANIAWQKSIIEEDERVARGEDVSGV